MSGNQGQYSKTIKLKTLMDTNDVIQGLRKIREELNSTTSNKARGILGSVDTDLIKLEKTASSLQASLAKGFSSNKEVAAFDKNLDSIITHVLEIREQLQKATTASIADLPKKLDQDLEKIAKKTKNLQDKYRAQMISAATNANVSDKSSLMKIIKNANIENSMFDERKEKLKNEIELNKEKIKQLQQEAAERAKIKNIEAAAKSSIFSKTGKDNRLAFTDYFRPAKENMGSQGQLVRAYDEGKDKYLPQFNNEALKTINQTYSQALLMAAKSGKDIDTKQLYNDIVKTLKETYGILIQDNMAKQLRALVTSDIQNVVSAGKNITPSDLKLGKEAAALTKQNANNQTELNAIEALAPIAREAAVEFSKLNEEEEKVRQNNIQLGQSYEVISQDMSQLDGHITKEVTGWENIRRELLSTAETQNRVDSGFGEIARRMTYLLSAANVFRFLRRQISTTFKDVQKLDKSFAQIAMVTRYHVSDLWQNYDQYAAMANKLGQETNDVVQASVLFYQQGLETNEVLQLTEDTMKLATLAGTDFAEATDLMTAALRGFKLEMSEGSHVTDVYSELAAHAAASVNEIATAMNKTAAIANSAGMSFENTAAFLTQMINNIVPYNSDIILNCEYAGKPLELLLLSA